MPADASVIERARGGDPEAFNELVRTYQRRVLGTIYRLLGAPDEVEDVAQDVFIRMFRSLGKLRHAGGFELWLYRLAVNTTYDHLRKRRRRRDTPMSCLDEDQVHAMDAAVSGRSFQMQQRHREVREVVSRLLDRIPPGDRTLLVLKEVEGLSLNELGQVFGVGAGTVKVRLFRARKRALRACERMQEDKGEARTVTPPVRPAPASG